MSNSDVDERVARALARANWPIRRYALGEEPDDDLSATTTAAERVAAMWRLALESWAMAGRSVPDYPRSAAPGRILRGGPLADDDQ